LLDRMEILRLSGYTPEEKITIARTHLIPRRLAEAGLTPAQFNITDEALARIVTRYTREAGVRELDRALARMAQKIARTVAEGQTDIPPIRPEDLPARLGDERFMPEEARPVLPAGVATGLAWTEAGGDVLYIEASLLPESKELRLTGSLGDVMRESATAAQTFVVAHAEQLGFEPSLLTQSGVHFHVPAGAVPKDGPSAGLALVTALVSLCRGIPARRDTAMTGEISLSGLVLPVGGIKEKILAAHRAGLRRALLPKANERDIHKIPEAARMAMEIVLVDKIEDAIPLALTPSAFPRAATG
jgi:ATP-dependent Lon protease